MNLPPPGPMEKKDEWGWMILPRTRSAVSTMAGLAGYASVAIAVAGVLDPLLWSAGVERVSNALRNTGDILFCLWFAVLGFLAPWCHIVLLAERGSVLTRLACLVGVGVAVFLLTGMVYTCIAQELFLSYQLDLPLYLSLIWFVSTILNINNMAAAPLRLRIILPTAFFFLILCGLTLGIYELMLPYTILKVAACLLLFRPLLLLQRSAPLIVSLPPVE